MTKPILDQAHCMAILEPQLIMLHACVLDGFNTYHRTPPDLKAQHDGRAATTTVHAHIMHAVNREFAALAGVSLIDSKGLKVLNFGDRLVARFKKVNESGRHRNHISKQQVRFDNS